MTRKWAAEKKGNWNLEALAREFEGELDSLSIWEITSPLFYYLSPEYVHVKKTKKKNTENKCQISLFICSPKNPSRSKFSSMFDVPIQRK